MHTYLIKRTPFFEVNSLSHLTSDQELGNACGIRCQRLRPLLWKALALSVGKKGYNHG